MVIVLRVGKLTSGKPFISAFDSTLSRWRKLQNIQYTWKQDGYQFSVLWSQQRYYYWIQQVSDWGYVIPLLNIPCFRSISVTAVSRSQMQDQGLIELYQKNSKSLKSKEIKQQWENQQKNRKMKWQARYWERWDRSLLLPTQTTHLLGHFASWCKSFSKSEFSKQRCNLIMRLVLNMQTLCVSKITPSPPFLSL